MVRSDISINGEIM